MFAKQFFLLFILLAGSAELYAQHADADAETDTTIYQLSGVVLDRENGAPIPYCRVSTLRNKRITVSDESGFFSLPVTRQDTLLYERFGFFSESMSMGKYIEEYDTDSSGIYIYAIQYMLREAMIIDTIEVRAYNTPQELKLAILNMPTMTRLPIETINHRVDAETMSYFMNNLPVDEADRLRVARQRYIEYYENRQTVTNASVDPIAVYKFIKLLKDKKKK